MREEKNPRDHTVEEIFTREQVTRFTLSLSDNRLAKFSLIKMNELVEVKIIFESVFKKHQFAELLALTEQTNRHISQPLHRPLRSRSSGSDLSMLNLTWNMGGTNQSVFAESPGEVLADIDFFDLVAICTQECPRKLKAKRASEVEAYMTAHGFISISTEFLEMWEMFLLVFIKASLFDQVANVSAMKIAKGAMRHMIGNKGCIAYNFTL